MNRPQVLRTTLSHTDAVELFTPLLPTIWTAYDDALFKLNRARENYPFLASGPIQASRLFLLSAIVDELQVRLGDGEHGVSFREQFGFMVMQLRSECVVRFRNVDDTGHARSNRSNRSASIDFAGQLTLFEDVPIEGPVLTLGHKICPFFSAVECLFLTWRPKRSSGGWKWRIYRPDDSVSATTPPGRPTDSGDLDGVVVRPRRNER